jgi:hypothetical protein
VGYSETSKAYRIYVPGKKFIEVSRDVTFHEEATFRRSRELPCDIKEQEAPSSEPSDSQLSDEQREKAREPSVDPIRDSVEFPLEKPPAKRKPAWCHFKGSRKDMQHLKVPSEKARNQINTQV